MDDKNNLHDRLDEILELLRSQEARISALERKEKPHTEVSYQIKEEKPQQSKKAFDWHFLEFSIGKYWLQGVGALLFLAGIFFFLKYAFEHNLISPIVRVMIAACTGIGLIALSDYMRRRYQTWAYAVLAAGIALLFLASYSAYAWHGLISAPVSLALSVLLACIGLWLSVVHNTSLAAYITVIGIYAMLRYVPSMPTMTEGIHDILSGALILAAVAVGLYQRWYVFPLFTLLLFSFLSAHYFNSYHGMLLLIFCIVPLVYAYRKPSSSFYEPLVSGIGAYIIFYRWMSMIVSKFRTQAAARGFSAYVNVSSFEKLFVPGTEHIVFDRLSLLCSSIFFIAACICAFLKTLSDKIVLMTFSIAVAFLVQVLFKHMTYWEPYPLIISASLSFFAVLFLAYGLVADKEKYCYGAYTLFALTFLGTLMPKDMVLRTAYTMSSNLEANLAALGLIIAFLSMYVLFTRVRNAPTHYTHMLLAGAALVPLLWFHTFVWLPPYDSLITAFYGGILLIVGYISGIKIIRIIAACALIQSQIYGAEHYFISVRSELPFSVLLLLGGLSLIFIFLSYALMAVKKQDTLEDRYIIQGVNAMAFIAPFMLGRTLIVIAAHYYALLLKASSAFSSFIRHLAQGSDLLTREDLSASYSYRSYALACYYGLTGLLLIMSGFAYKKPYVRYGGLFLFFLAVIRLMVIANSLLNPLMRMVSFAILGIILIGTSFLYQRVVKYQSDND